MRELNLFLILIFFVTSTFAQSENSDTVSEDEKIFMVAEKMPEFPGGDLGLREYIAAHLKYPSSARERGIEGKVYVRFCITSKGTIGKINVIRSVDPLLDREAVRVIKYLPKWIAGENNGKKVNVWYTCPVNFSLE